MAQVPTEPSLGTLLVTKLRTGQWAYVKREEKERKINNNYIEINKNRILVKINSAFAVANNKSIQNYGECFAVMSLLSYAL